MATSAAGTVWNDLNYYGALFTASPEETPLLAMSGGLNGMYTTNNFEFPCSQEYSHPTVAQPAITETASLTIPTAIIFDRTQYKNVAQIFHEHVSFSYERLANAGYISGVTATGQAVQPADILDFTIATALKHIARDFEYTMIQGDYQIATSAAVANKSRGLNHCAVDGSTTVAAGSAQLSKALLNSLLQMMWDAGARFVNPLIVVNAWQKMQLSSIYGYAPTDRNIGGVNIKQIETDFGSLGVLMSPFQSTSILLVADMAYVKVVSQPVPGKGHLFYEPLGKTAAAEAGQIFGKLGLDHGPYWMHGTITGLATA